MSLALAILAAKNEKRQISHVLEALIKEGLDIVLLDDGSTDGTLEIASSGSNASQFVLTGMPRLKISLFVNSRNLFEKLSIFPDKSNGIPRSQMAPPGNFWM